MPFPVSGLRRRLDETHVMLLANAANALERTAVRDESVDLGKVSDPDRRGPFAAVVSSLPLMTLPGPARKAFVADALALVVPGGRLVQFSYAARPPAPASPGRYFVRGGGFVALNLPPARVWTYHRAGEG